MEEIRLDIIPKGIMPVCHCSQYDTGRVIRLNLMNGLQGYTLSDETIELDVRKPDNHIVTSSVTVESGKTYVDIVTTEQMCACEGDNICELKISKDGAEICSLNFKMRVEKSVLEGGDESESFIYNLSEQIAEAVADQYDSNNVIFDNAPTTGHGTPYTVTSEGIKTIIDNLKVADLSDVTITTPTQGEALVFDNDGNLVNGTVSTVGSIDDLNDVDTTGKVKDSSIVWDGSSEFIAKKLTVEMNQADYDALGGNYSNYKGCHIVIKDGQDVTCNLGDLNDVDTTGASTGDILVKGASGWEKKTPTSTITGITTDSTNVKTGAIIEAYKDNRTVIVNVVSISTKIAYTESAVKLASGLPIPLSSYCRGILVDVDTHKAYRCAIDSNGDLYSWYQTIPIDVNMYGLLVYISNS